MIDVSQNHSLTLQEWFSANLRRPVLVGLAICFVSSALWATFQYRRLINNEHLAVEQLANSLTFAVNHHERSIAEHLLAAHISREAVLDVALCDGDNVLMGLPSSTNSCASQSDGLTAISRAPIKGASSKYVMSTLSLRSIFVSGGLYLAIYLLGAMGLVATVRTMATRFKRDLVDPIAANLQLSSTATTDSKFSTPVAELQQLYDAHRAALDETRRLTEENAVQARNSAMAFLVQTVAHDVRKPFARISAGLRVLARNGSESGERTDFDEKLQDLQASVDNEISGVEDLLSDIMDYGGTTIADPVPFDVAKLVQGHAAQYSVALGAKQIELATDLEPDLGISGNPRKLRRVLENLIENAIEAMPHHATLTLQATRIGDKVHLSVANTGSVIPEGIREKLFQPFATSGKQNGTGLGLAIVYRIVEQHCGRIWCESDLQHGTRFTMEFPHCDLPEVYETPLPQANRTAEEATPSRPLSIALIEDDIWVQEDWEAMPGLKVTSYPSPTEFLAQVRDNASALSSFDAIVTDYYFDSDESSSPVLSGSDVLECVRNTSVRIPVFLASNASPSEGDKKFTSSIGKKALSPETLRSLIAH